MNYIPLSNQFFKLNTTYIGNNEVVTCPLRISPSDGLSSIVARATCVAVELSFSYKHIKVKRLLSTLLEKLVNFIGYDNG